MLWWRCVCVCLRYVLRNRWYINMNMCWVCAMGLVYVYQVCVMDCCMCVRCVSWTGVRVSGVCHGLVCVCQVCAMGLVVGYRSYLHSGWNVMDGILVVISLVDILLSLTASSHPRIFGILRVFRLLRTLRPLRLVTRVHCAYDCLLLYISNSLYNLSLLHHGITVQVCVEAIKRAVLSLSKRFCKDIMIHMVIFIHLINLDC